MRVTLWEGEVETVRYAQLVSRGVDVTLRLNDIPVVTGAADRMVTAGMPVRQFTVPGQNVLTLEVGDITAPAGVGGWSGLAQVTGRIADFVEGAQLELDAGTQHAILAPEFTEQTPNPLSVSAPFESRIGGEWHWTRAPVIDPVRAKPQLDAFFAGVHAAYVARDMSGLLPLFEPAIRDRVAAYPVLSIDGQIRMTGARFSTIDPETWEMEPFDPANAVYRPAAGGRMVEALDRSGRALIRSKPIPSTRAEVDPRVVEWTNLVGVWNGQLAVLV